MHFCVGAAAALFAPVTRLAAQIFKVRWPPSQAGNVNLLETLIKEGTGGAYKVLLCRSGKQFKSYKVELNHLVADRAARVPLTQLIATR